MYDIITMGSGTLDVFIDTKGKLFRACKGSRATIPFGSKLLIEGIRFSTGGGGTNTAAGFSRLGFKTAWIGKIGQDETAHLLLKEMKREKVDTRYVIQASCHMSGYSVILDATGHDRTILAYKGCNNCLRYSELPVAKIRATWMYCSSMMDASLSSLMRAVSTVSKKGTKVAMNPSSYMITKEKKKLSALLKHVTVLVFNEEERQLLTGKCSLEKGIAKLHAMGPSYVIVTDGKKGSWGSDGARIVKVRAPSVRRVVESTGAGDAFAVGCISGIMRGKDLKTALQMGAANAGSVISHFGAKDLLLSRSKMAQAVSKVK